MTCAGDSLASPLHLRQHWCKVANELFASLSLSLFIGATLRSMLVVSTLTIQHTCCCLLSQFGYTAMDLLSVHAMT